MLKRQSYFDYKQSEIEKLVLETLSTLKSMMGDFGLYLREPTTENKTLLLEKEQFIDKNEKVIESTIHEVISLEQIDPKNIKWLFAINRIIRELERVGDQLINIVTLIGVLDTKMLVPLLNDFFGYEKEMLGWLTYGMQYDDAEKLQQVISHDAFVNHLNKRTYKRFVELINEEEKLTESWLKMVIVSRFLERIGDHLVNAAKAYKSVICFNAQLS
ncbi:PhoU domain-containing protein [Oceanobacillus picturae]|uniref:PhoU domain-containing protein n=1 Tax=Oceanobacillus picturae TaxID=171693 RepID=UPI000E684545|nr:PhoU domain-containing protein [Oceanobacillus picturae]RIU94840.1 hypothetical protein D1864_03470 [Oceanobacillus picturae]